MTIIAVHAVITPKPEHVEDVLSEMQVMVQGSRQEPGCLRYDLLRHDDGGTVRLHVQERYRDMDAVQAHRDSAHYVAYRAKAGAWFQEVPVVTLLQEVDVA
ncbi:putative quinol monooxygenase [Deinococcus frigens]|uniref:putative quinol monooxygenase n=1 Tax=Deinococcus frigens TaxID=249403 RepID=UPI000496D7DC|nr:putative quinol monooxygenase [Deinococcus frigens]